MTYYKCGSVYTTQNSNVVVDTASGAVANFQTPLAMPLLKTRFDFKATQDLHGQSGPYPAGGSAQKWDEETELGSFDTETGEKTPNNNLLRSVTPIPVSPNTTYLRRMNESLGCRIFQYDSNMDFISQDVSSERLLTFTTANNCAFINIAFQKAATGVGINYPATDTSYHPYSNICPIDGWDEINGIHCKKNLFNLDYLTASGITIQNGEVSGTAQAFSVSFGANAKGLKNKVKFKANTQYTLKFKAYTDANAETQYVGLKVYFWYTDGNTASVSCPNNTLSYTDFSVSSHANKTIDYISISYSNGWANTWHLKDIQLEEGASATEYEPYNGSTTLINLGGTYYGGYVSQDKDGKRELVVTHKIFTFSGNESWQTSTNFFYLPAGTLDDVPVQTNILTSNGFTINPMTNKQIRLYPSYGINSNFISMSSSVQDLNGYLSNGIMFKYELAEPIIIDLPDGTPFKSLPGVNNIFADTGDTSLQFRKIG